MPEKQKQFDFNRGAQLRILERAIIPDPPPERRTKRTRNKGTLKAILKALDSFQRGAASCFPSIPTLATHTGFSARTIKRGLRSLDSLGLVSITQGRRANGSRGASIYAIQWLVLLDLVPADPDNPPDAAVPQAGQGQQQCDHPKWGDNLSRWGDNLSQVGCQDVTPSKRTSKHPLKRKEHMFDVAQEEKSRKGADDRGSRIEDRDRRKSRGKTFWGFERPLTRSDLTNGATVQTLFEFALARGWGDLQATELDRLKFFALCRFCGHKASDPNDCGRYLTYLLKEKLFGNIREEDDEAARRFLARQRSEETQRERAAEGRGEVLASVAAMLFVPPCEERRPDRRAELARRAAAERVSLTRDS